MDSNAYCHCARYATAHMHCRADVRGSIFPVALCDCHRHSGGQAAARVGARRLRTVRGARHQLDGTDRRSQAFADDRRVMHRRAQERRARGRFWSDRLVENRRARGRDRRRRTDG
jgi:hypothetical protein